MIGSFPRPWQNRSSGRWRSTPRKRRREKNPRNVLVEYTTYVAVLASLGVAKTVADFNHKIIMTLTSDYEKNALFCTARMSLERRSKA